MFHFTELEKKESFLRPDLIPTLHLLKPKALLSIMVVTMVIVATVKVMYSGRFFLSGFTFMNIHNSQDNNERGKLYF